MAAKKRGMRKVPLFIETRLGSLGNDFRVAVVQRINIERIKAGDYAHVGLTHQNGSIGTAGPLLLGVDFGRYAKRNIEGQTVVRRDLPKIEKKICYVNPRPFGNPPPCDVTQFRMVWQREHFDGPRHLIEAVVLLAGDESCIVRFNITTALSALNVDIDRELLLALNLLQEAVGGINVFPPEATVEEYLDTIQVKWEILPAGERESNIRKILSSMRPTSQDSLEDLERRANERYDFLESLSPRNIVRGTGGMGGYIGALINDALVVFENLHPGNGTYILFGDWETQSQRTKTDLLTNGSEGEDYIRVIHSGDWQLRIRNLVASRAQ
ncbi:hypothetical protein ACFQBQ_17220 [Granulicella cerasi]|uniref:Uncharacterized protein n=1 Tax=Granulicella cerasi TaxID=741063 RepID=A0ABW1ZD00_9BACT|nr:hypothetical protein [Granulicella cerasi]